MLRQQRYTPLLSVKLCQTVSSIQTAGAGYNVLNVSKFKHFRINHSKLFAARKITSTGSSISGRRCPAGYAHIPDREVKPHMRKLNGVPKEHFGLFLKECKWRFNNPKPQA